LHFSSPWETAEAHCLGEKNNTPNGRIVQSESAHVYCFFHDPLMMTVYGIIDVWNSGTHSRWNR
jgi:hypothetical protein